MINHGLRSIFQHSRVRIGTGAIPGIAPVWVYTRGHPHFRHGSALWQLGQLSFWYDEVVTMRLAQAPGPGALLDRLFEIDATRAPLHPLLLQAWVRLFGSSETSARALSVLCGVVTVALVCWIGRLAFDSQTGLWAAWLAAWSPLLVYYSREARMYAWLVMVTCLCWGLLFSLRDSRSWLPHGRLLAWSHRPALFASPGSAHGGDAGVGFLALCRAFLRRLAALAGLPRRRGHSCGTLAAALFRPLARVPLGPAAGQVPAGDAHRVHRRQFRGPARARCPDRLRDRSPFSSFLDGAGLGRTGLPGALARCAADSPLRVFVARQPDLRPGAVHGLRRPGVPDLDRPGTEPGAEARRLDSRSRDPLDIGVGSRADRLCGRSEGRLAWSCRVDRAEPRGRSGAAHAGHRLPGPARK